MRIDSEVGRIVVRSREATIDGRDQHQRAEDLAAEASALRAEVARLKEIERLLLEEVQYYKGRADSTYETMLAMSRGLR